MYPCLEGPKPPNVDFGGPGWSKGAQVTPCGAELHHPNWPLVVLCGHGGSEVAPGGTRWSPVGAAEAVSGCVEQSKVVKSGPRWHQSGIKWYQVAPKWCCWSGSRWPRTVLGVESGCRWFHVLKAGTSWFQSGLAEVVSNGVEKFQMVQSGHRRPHVIPDSPNLVQLRCSGCSQAVPYGPKMVQLTWSQVVQRGSRWSELAPGGFKEILSNTRWYQPITRWCSWSDARWSTAVPGGPQWS